MKGERIRVGLAGEERREVHASKRKARGGRREVRGKEGERAEPRGSGEEEVVDSRQKNDGDERGMGRAGMMTGEARGETRYER